MSWIFLTLQGNLVITGGSCGSPSNNETVFTDECPGGLENFDVDIGMMFSALSSGLIIMPIITYLGTEK